jgi:hypothetical protein
MSCFHSENNIRCTNDVTVGKFCDFHINEHSFSRFVENMRKAILGRKNVKNQVSQLCAQYPEHIDRLLVELRSKQPTHPGIVRLKKVTDDLMTERPRYTTSFGSMVWVNGILVESY